MLNKTTRNLAHGIVKMVEVMKNEEKAVIKVHLLKYDDNRGKMLNFRPQRVVDGVVVKLDFLHIEKPPESLVEPYEEMKAEFLKNLGEKVIDTLQNSGKKLLTYNQNQILECWKEGISDEKIISEKTGIPKPKVNQNIGYMFKKGYRKEDFLSK
jgi:hypothetical protein